MFSTYHNMSCTRMPVDDTCDDRVTWLVFIMMTKVRLDALDGN